MNNFRIIRINLSFATAFLMFSTFAATTFSQTKPTATPTPKPKKQIIVNVTSARIRSAPNLQSETLKFADIGTVFFVIEEKKDWTNIELPEDKNGWISKTITTKFDDTNSG